MRTKAGWAPLTSGSVSVLVPCPGQMPWALQMNPRASGHRNGFSPNGSSAVPSRGSQLRPGSSENLRTQCLFLLGWNKGVCKE